jgi:hypothetical protein
MRRVIAGLCLLLLLPNVCAAGPHWVYFDVFGSGQNGSFDFDPTRADALLEFSMPRAFVTDGFSDVPNVGGSRYRTVALYSTFEARSGPRQSFVNGLNNSISYYTYGPGVFTLAADWSIPGQPDGSGGFTVPITSPFIFEVVELDSLFPGKSQSDFTLNMGLDLGPGEMDPALAAHLGVGPRILGGTLSLYVYGIGGDGSDSFRHGQIYTGASSFDIAVAPEPGTAALMALGVLGAWRRSMRVRRRAA